MQYSPLFYCSIIMNNHVSGLGLAQITVCCELMIYGVSSLTYLLKAEFEPYLKESLLQSMWKFPLTSICFSISLFSWASPVEFNWWKHLYVDVICYVNIWWNMLSVDALAGNKESGKHSPSSDCSFSNWKFCFFWEQCEQKLKFIIAF